MNTDLHKAYHNFCSLRTALISGAFAFAFFGGCATTVVAQDTMRGGGMRGGGMGGGGMGTATGIGIGIGIGQGLSSQPAVTPETPPSSKKTIKPSHAVKRRQPEDKPATVEQKPALIFVGKPDSVTYDPKQKVGKLGDLSDHKQVTVSKNGSYFIRHYYFVREGDQRSWFYYDVPDATAQNKDVPSCNVDDDNCDGPPQHPIYVDNPPTPAGGDGGSQIEEGQGQPCGEVRVRSAWTECKNKFVHQMQDTYNYCPPKTKYQVYHSDVATGTPCGGDGFTGGGTSAELPAFPLGKGCTFLRTDYVPYIGGTDWWFKVIDVYKCPGEKGEFRDPRQTEVQDGLVSAGPPKVPVDKLPALPSPPL